MAHVVFITMNVKSAQMDAVCSEVATVASRVVNEDGCLTFEAHRAADGSPTIYLFEKWTDKAALAVHDAQPYMKALYAKLGELLDGQPSIVEVKPVGA